MEFMWHCWILVAGFYFVIEVSGSDLGAMVYCGGDYIRLFIERAKYPYIDPSSFTLNGTGEGCNMYTSNKTHVISIIPLDRCGTTVNENADLLTFYNHLNTEVTKTKTGITRHPAVEFKFECSYFRTSTKSLMAFNPIGRIVTRPTAETGKFTFKMDMYQTDKFLNSYTHFPVKVHLKERIFFQVKLKGNTSDLMLFLQNCRATPSDDVNDTIGYDFIKDGCPVDSSLTLKQEDEPKQRFSLSAFRFIPGVRDIFLHCQVLVCHKENKNSRCNTNCTNEPPTLQSNSQILRHRRDLTIVSSVPNITDVGDKKYVASLGPIRILLDEALKPVLLGVRNGTSVINYDWFNLLLAIIIAIAMRRFS